MYILLMTLIIIVAILLILVVLAQNSKGGGLTSQFGGSGASNMIGVKKTGDLLEKITWGFAIALMVLAFSTKFLFNEGNNSKSETGGPILGGGQEESIAPSLDLEENVGDTGQPTESGSLEEEGTVNEASEPIQDGE